LILPGLTGEKVGTIAVAVDCSGSIDDKTLDLFSAEIKGIAEDVCPAEIRVSYFDSKILRVESFGPETYSSLKLSPIGGGGTAFSPIFEDLEKVETPIVALVVLTDLCCRDYGLAPEFPVLWAAVGATDGDLKAVPFGETLRIEERE
jgi:predicted metal-dependent peptidase